MPKKNSLLNSDLRHLKSTNAKRVNSAVWKTKESVTTKLLKMKEEIWQKEL